MSIEQSFLYVYFGIWVLIAFVLLLYSFWKDDIRDPEVDELLLTSTLLAIFWPVLLIVVPLFGVHAALRWLVQNAKHTWLR